MRFQAPAGSFTSVELCGTKQVDQVQLLTGISAKRTHGYFGQLRFEERQDSS